MKTSIISSRNRGAGWRAAVRTGLAVAFLLAGRSLEAATVQTWAGGRSTAAGPDAGFVDGSLVNSAQFNQPAGLALDRNQNLIVADTGNDAVRKLGWTSSDCITIIRNISRPVDVAFDSEDNLYVLAAGSGLVFRYDPFDHLFQFPVTLNSAAFVDPTAFTIDSGTNLFVAESGGSIKRLSASSAVPIIVATGLGKLGGITIMESGLLAVTESDRNTIRLIDPGTGLTVQTIGVPKNTITDGIYFRDGPGDIARFNHPQGIKRTANNSLVVADRLNHRVRVISSGGVVTTLYGIDPSLWEPECLNCNPLILPGWYDGNSGDGATAEAREPAGVAVDNTGLAYVSEQYYHIIRSVVDVGLVNPTPGGGDTNLVVLAPTISPNYGYHPMGTLVTVTNPNTNSFFRNAVYFTTDGTEPTTNSQPVILTNGVGTIVWRESTRSLASLRIRAFVGTTGGEVVAGKQAEQNEVGLSRNLLAGMGSTVILPIVANLRAGPENVLRSLQFRVEVKPTNGAPMIASQMALLPFDSNPMVPIKIPATGPPPSGLASPYSFGTTRGMIVAYVGTSSGFQAAEFAVVGLLSVPIPPGATPGQGYWVSILEPSATSDASQTAVPIAPMPPRQITVANVSYIVGDSSPSIWYNADNSVTVVGSSVGFGNGNLRNSDVNNAFEMALGSRSLPASSDLFDAMDAYPSDSAGKAGGDGQIRFLDWQVILNRSLAMDTENWRRTWSANGVRVATPATLNTNAFDEPASSFDATLRAEVWDPPAEISAGFREFMEPGATAEIPIAINLFRGSRLAGMQFRVSVQPRGNTPALVLPVRFEANTDHVPAPIEVAGFAGHELAAAWSMAQNPFSPPLAGSTILGTLFVTVPDSVRPGDAYDIVFSHTSGAPDFSTEYEFDLVDGSLWIAAARPSPAPPRVIRGLKLSWFGASGARFDVESSGDLKTWATVATGLVGTGRNLEYIDTQTTRGGQFYRVIESP